MRQKTYSHPLKQMKEKFYRTGKADQGCPKHTKELKRVGNGQYKGSAPNKS